MGQVKKLLHEIDNEMIDDEYYYRKWLDQIHEEYLWKEQQKMKKIISEMIQPIKTLTI